MLYFKIWLLVALYMHGQKAVDVSVTSSTTDTHSVNIQTSANVTSTTNLQKPTDATNTRTSVNVANAINSAKLIKSITSHATIKQCTTNASSKNKRTTNSKRCQTLPSKTEQSAESREYDEVSDSDASQHVRSTNSKYESNPAFANRDTRAHLSNDCGRTRFDNKQNRIIQGNVSRVGQFPWIVRLGLVNSATKQIFFFCGGSLVNRFYVVSAAHCEEKGDIVRVGENYINTDIDCDETGACAPKHQDIKIKSYEFQPYCSVNHHHDIALIELETPVTFNDYVQPICLPAAKINRQKILNRKVSLAGWGMTDAATQTFTDYLMYIIAPVINYTICDTLYPHDMIESQLCIGYDHGRDTCGGDSGGPASMSIKLSEGRRVFLVGVVSYGLVDCGNGPAVYTDVSYYLSWLLKHIKRN